MDAGTGAGSAPAPSPAPAAGSSASATPPAGNGTANTAPVTPPVTPAGTPPPVSKQKFKFQVDGKEVENEYTPEEVHALLQKGLGADKRFNEANQIKQQTERLVTLLKNPKELKKLLAHPQLYGDKARQIVEEMLWEDLQREQMDPKERELQDSKAELERLRAESQERQRAEQKRQFEAARAKYALDINTEIDAALQEAGVIKSAYAQRRVAYYMLAALEGGKRITAAQAIPFVKADLEADLRSMFESASEDSISTLLSDKAWDNVRKADLKRVAKVPPTAAPAPATTLQPRDANGQFVKKNNLRDRSSIFDL